MCICYDVRNGINILQNIQTMHLYYVIVNIDYTLVIALLFVL